MKYILLAVVAFLLDGGSRLNASSSSPEARPSVDILGAVSAANIYIRGMLKRNGFYVAWAGLTRFNNNEPRRWITVWYPEANNSKAAGEILVVSIETRGNNMLISKVDNPFGFGNLGKTDKTIGIGAALKSANKFASKMGYSVNHYVYRAGLGKFSGSEAVYWIVCWWPEVDAENNYTWPVVAVNMKGEPAVVDEPITWLPISKIDVPSRAFVPPPDR